MPTALLRSCSWPGGCAALVRGSRCSAHRPARPSPDARGYDARWQSFRLSFARRLVALQILPSCGAALPDGPAMLDSRCKRDGLLVTTNLELDHDPPLRLEERAHPRIVCSPTRVGFLCASCHSRKTLREMAEGGRISGRLTAAPSTRRARVRIVSGA